MPYTTHSPARTPGQRRGRWRRRARRGAVVAFAVALAATAAAPAYAGGALNGRIAFTSFRDAELGDLWTMNPDGGRLRKLTGGPLYDAQADWSPDGQRIAFRRGPNAFRRLGVWKMDLYGNDLSLLAEGDPSVPSQNASQPSWASDRRSMLFRATFPPYPDSDIWRMDTDGRNQRLVAHIPAQQLYPSYSPDMSKVLFTSTHNAGSNGSDRGIYRIDADGSNLTEVFDQRGAYDSAPTWSPDGKRIAFESNRDGDMELYVMDADGGNVRQLTHNAIDDEGPAWSPDGLKLAFNREPQPLNGDIWTMDADGTNEQRLMDNPGRDESPDWQPIPHEGDYAACGDVMRSGAGPYSVKAAGQGVSCEKAKDVAARWSDAALAGDPDRSVRGFDCAGTDAGYEALKVECTHRGNRGAHGNDKSVLFVGRGD